MRIIIEHIDPAHLVPGGIDTCISDVVRYGNSEEFGIVGITTDPKVSLGVWRSTSFSGRQVDFMPVARFDRSSAKAGLRIPHSLKLSLGLIRYIRRLPRNAIWQVHRIEVGLIAAAMRPNKLVQFIHNDSSGLTGDNSDSSWKGLAALYRIVERAVLKTCSGVVVFNKTDGPRIRSLRADALIAQTWYNPALFNPTLREYAIRDGRLTVCWVGRLEAQKDPVLAVRVCGELAKSVPDCRFIIAGSGSLLQDSQSWVEKLGLEHNIEFVGSRTRSEVAEMMAKSDCMLMTSHYEGSPRVLAEAGGIGLPVVATEGGDPDGALVVGVNGVRVSSRLPADLAAAVVVASKYSSSDCQRLAAHRSAGPSVEKILGVGV